MNPLPLVFLALAIARALATNTEGSPRTPPAPRPERERIFCITRLITVATCLVLIGLARLAVLSRDPPFIDIATALGYLAAASLLWNPLPFYNATFVRWRIPWIAYGVALMVPGVRWGGHRSAALVAALNALLAGAPRSPRLLAFLQRQVAALEYQMHPSAQVARALYAEFLGDLDRARALMSIAASPNLFHHSGPAQRFARRWIAADALARKDYNTIVTLSTEVTLFQEELEVLPRNMFFLDARTKCVVEIAKVGLGKRRTKWILWIRWILAGAPRALRPFIFEATGAVDRRRPAEGVDEPLDDDPWIAVLEAHARARRLGARHDEITRDAWVRLVYAWDTAAESQAWRAAAKTAAQTADVVLDDAWDQQLVEDAITQLASEFERRGFDVPESLGEVSGGVVETLTATLVDRTRDAAEALASACQRGLILESFESYAEYRRCYDRAARLGGASGAQQAWWASSTVVCNAAVQLWNVICTRELPHIMFRWLGEEAWRRGDGVHARLYLSNASLRK